MTDAIHTLQRLYDSEINFSISTFWDAGFAWKLGDDMNGFKAEGQKRTFDAAVEELAEAARKQWPHSVFADPDGAESLRIRKAYGTHQGGFSTTLETAP